MGTQEELADFMYHAGQIGFDIGDHAAHGAGVVFKSYESARKFAETFDKDLVRIDGKVSGWLAQNRAAMPGPMPTADGDVIVHHVHQRFQLWIVTSDGAQQPDPNIESRKYWTLAEAEHTARISAKETGGMIYRLQNDDCWTILPSLSN